MNQKEMENVTQSRHLNACIIYQITIRIFSNTLLRLFLTFKYNGKTIILSVSLRSVIDNVTRKQTSIAY